MPSDPNPTPAPAPAPSSSPPPSGARMFQINLRGIIELLSDHLYSGPQVFARELLQNATDAIRARGYLEPGHEGRVVLEVIGGGTPGSRPTLMVEDNGVGLTEDEVHRFLATIGTSSKRDEFWDRETDFIGRFGIGLLSGFVVSDEIVVVTRSAREPDAPAVEWRGKADGTYTVRRLDREVSPGTRAYLTARADMIEYFDPERVAELAAHYGALLPFPIEILVNDRPRRINAEGAPWRRTFADEAERTEALLDYGRRVFGIDFIDVIPIRSKPGAVEGLAFVLPHSPSLATRRTHRVYLKNMLLSESAENLLPEWAFFVKCVANAEGLRPTASREAFHEDETLARAREALGACLKTHLVRLAEHDPERLRRVIALHYLSIKGLAAGDDEFYRLFIDWLPFETSLGRMSFGEIREREAVIAYVPNLDQFRQIAAVAAAQSRLIVNAAYTYDRELVEKFPDVFEEGRIEPIDPEALTRSFEDLDPDEEAEASDLMEVADEILRPFRCATEIRKFAPPEMPALHCLGSEAEFRRAIEQSKEISSPLWGSLLDGLGLGRGDDGGDGFARLCFNHANPLVRRLIRARDRRALAKVVPMLYVQSLLMGHRPLKSSEMEILNQGLIDLIEWGLEARGREAGSSSSADAGPEPGPRPGPGPGPAASE